MARRAASLEEYQAKVADDSGVTRSKVPSPLLRDMRARPGDYLTFRLEKSGSALMSVVRSKGKSKAKKKPSG